jgi:hypothetical protein
VDEAANKADVQARGVRGFPTFQFYLNGKMVKEFSGADPNKLGGILLICSVLTMSLNIFVKNVSFLFFNVIFFVFLYGN